MAPATATADVSTSSSEKLEARLGAHPEVGAKSFDVKFKTDGLAEGEFIAYASVFGNKDLVGDVMMKGAFTDTLAAWQRKGVPIPLLWGHNTADPDYNLGYVEAEQDEKGLKVHAYLDMDSPKSAQTYRLLKSGRVNQMSITYRVADGAYVMPEGDGKSYEDAFYEIRALDLFEVSVVPIAANQEAEVVAVKSVVSALASKAGRTLSAKNETALRGALAQAEEVVTALKSVLPAAGEADEEDQEQTSGKEPPPDATEQKSAPPQSDTATPSPSVLLALSEIHITESECTI
ncbi:HK97 family phage prohead protease [Mycobacterium sp. NPDC050041]|uniref:HK97 family phage prohead protease n=1 Tax=Mycobacterium sp. NPDC050041 TaxID=3364293 RepID=UPI003C301947